MLRFLSEEPRASTSFGNASTRESLPVLKSRIAVCFSLLSHLLMTACSSLKVQWFTTWNTAASTGSDGTSAGAFVSGVADAAAGAGLGAALRVHAPPQIATAAKHSASAEWRTDLSEQPTLSMDCTLMTAHRLGEIRGP